MKNDIEKQTEKALYFESIKGIIQEIKSLDDGLQSIISDENLISSIDIDDLDVYVNLMNALIRAGHRVSILCQTAIAKHRSYNAVIH